MPAIDSATCAVTAAMRLRTSVNATCERTWNQRVRSSAGGTITDAASASRQSRTYRPIVAATSVSPFATSVASPSLRTSESASMSLVRRAMIQPARCCEK